MKKLILLLLFISCSSNHKKVVVAHRGASGYLPEHTRESVVLAHSFNPQYIEPDVVMTRDNHLIVIHDIHLDTTTNVAQVYPSRKRKDGRYYAIDFTLREIKRLSVHERLSKKTAKAKYPTRFNAKNKSFKIPTLSEFIELIKDLNRSRGKNIGIYVEMKAPEFHFKHKKDITKRLYQTLKRHNVLDGSTPVIIQSFWPNALKRLKDEFKVTVPLVQLIAENSWNESSVDYDAMMTKEGMQKIAQYATGVGPWINQFIRDPNGRRPQINDLITWIREAKLEVHPYTARADDLPVFVENYKQLMDLLFKKLKVDGVFSDQANLTLEYLNK